MAPEMAGAIFDTGLLFDALAASGQMSAESAHLLLFTRRHYPSRADGWRKPEMLCWSTIGEILAL